MASIFVGLLVVGCRQQASELQSGDPSSESVVEVPLAASELLDRGSFDEAAEAIQRQLIQTPNDRQANFLAAKIEAARGHPEEAIAILSARGLDRNDDDDRPAGG